MHGQPIDVYVMRTRTVEPFDLDPADKSQINDVHWILGVEDLMQRCVDDGLVQVRHQRVVPVRL